jgi:hypothetical protein
VLKNNGTTEYALRGGNAATGASSKHHEGASPDCWNPMKKQGAMAQGSGGDCCETNTNQGQGTFDERRIVSGYASDATDNSVQANSVAAGHSK